MSGAFDLLRRIKRADDRRPGVPGEHWMSFGTGLALFRAARRSPSPVLRTVAWAGAALFVARALSGRDGVLQKLQNRRRP